MSYVDTVIEILRRHPELRPQLEGQTSRVIVEGFARTFGAERRDALGVVAYPGQEQAAETEPPRHPGCRCSNPPSLCTCAAAGYEVRDPVREAAMIAELRRYGWDL